MKCISIKQLFKRVANIFTSLLRCCNKVPKTGWLQTAETSCLIVLEAASPRSGCQKGHALSEGCKGESFLVFSSFGYLPATLGVPWLVDASFQSYGHLLSVSSHYLPSVYLSLCPNFLYIRTPVLYG